MKKSWGFENDKDSRLRSHHIPVAMINPLKREALYVAAFVLSEYLMLQGIFSSL